MATGARNMFGAPMFESEVFRKQMCCIEESTCDVVGTFRRPPQSFGVPRSDSAPPMMIQHQGIVPPFPSSLRPCSTQSSRIDWTVDFLFLTAIVNGAEGNQHKPLLSQIKKFNSDWSLVTVSETQQYQTKSILPTQLNWANKLHNRLAECATDNLRWDKRTTRLFTVNSSTYLKRLIAIKV